MPTLEGETAVLASAEQSAKKSSSGSPKLNNTDSSSISSLQDTRYLSSIIGAANVNIKLEIPTRRTATMAVQAISNCHSRKHNYFHSLTSSSVGNNNSQRFHNADECSNNGQSVMDTITTVLSRSLASFNGNSNINIDGNPNATESDNSITFHTNHNETNNSTKLAVPSPKMTSKSEHLTGGSTSTKTTSIFGSIDDNIVGSAPTSAFMKPQQLEQPSCVSHEDVASLAGASFLNSQVECGIFKKERLLCIMYPILGTSSQLRRKCLGDVVRPGRV
uniref:Uncharacterized protein n=1 Tax=Glossina austeni TaxID=7395 RepID=A0A1A9VHW9_GLOAU